MIVLSIVVLVLAVYSVGLGTLIQPLQSSNNQSKSTMRVNCSAGQTISGALASAPASKPVTIIVTGTCAESVTITRDDVTLQGANPSSGIKASSGTLLTLEEAHRILLQQLQLTGGSSGLFADLGSSFQATNLVLTNQTFGITATGSSAGTISGSTVTNSTSQGIVASGGYLIVNNCVVEKSRGDGIVADNSGSMIVNNSTIEDSAWAGVHAAHGSYIDLGQKKIVTITNSGQDGVAANTGGSVTIHRASIRGNGSAGVRAYWGGSIDIRSALIVDNAGDGVAADSGIVNIQGTSPSENVTISGNGDGIIDWQSSAVSIGNNVAIVNNHGDGLNILGGSSATVNGTLIRQNMGNGVTVHDTSVLGTGKASDITNNSGWGIFCAAGTPGGIFGPLNGTITGNGAGQNNCKVFS